MRVLRYSIFLLMIVLLILISACDCSSKDSQQHSASVSIQSPPNSPANLLGKAESDGSVTLSWIDNSNNEDGFRIYRDNQLLAELSTNISSYTDGGLESSKTYIYSLLAYNTFGDSTIISCQVKIPNPPIEVILNRVGVIDNGEDLFRDEDGGEVYLGYIITDGNTLVKGRLPAFDGNYLHLYDNDDVEVNLPIFSTNEVGDYIRIAIVGYESDGGSGEQLLYEGLALAAQSYISGAAATLLDISGVGLGNIIGKLFGSEDDWLGSYESAWTSYADWGIGNYLDIPCQKEEGTIGLRLWFTIQNPKEPLPTSPSNSSTPHDITITIPPIPTTTTTTTTPIAEQNVRIVVNILSFEDTSASGEGPDQGDIGDPYFHILVGNMEAISGKPVAEGVDYINNPFSATFDIDDNSLIIPIAISVWDYDGGWSGDEQYDCGSLSGTGSGLMFTTLYDVSQESVMYVSDGSLDGGLEGPQAIIVVEIITLRN